MEAKKVELGEFGTFIEEVITKVAGNWAEELTQSKAAKASNETAAIAGEEQPKGGDATVDTTTAVGP